MEGFETVYFKEEGFGLRATRDIKVSACGVHLRTSRGQAGSVLETQVFPLGLEGSRPGCVPHAPCWLVRLSALLLATALDRTVRMQNLC